MITVTYSEARQNLASLMHTTVNDANYAVITRAKGESCVLMSLSEFEALKETGYLMRAPANAEHLLKSINQLKTNQLIEMVNENEV